MVLQKYGEAHVDTLENYGRGDGTIINSVTINWRMVRIEILPEYALQIFVNGRSAEATHYRHNPQFSIPKLCQIGTGMLNTSHQHSWLWQGLFYHT